MEWFTMLGIVLVVSLITLIVPRTAAVIGTAWVLNHYNVLGIKDISPAGATLAIIIILLIIVAMILDHHTIDVLKEK